MKKENVKKAKKIISERILKVKQYNKQKEQDPNLKQYQDVVFSSGEWEGW